MIIRLLCVTMWVVVAVVAAIVMVATYLTWTATRVDRLHARVAAAFSALDAHLVRRAAAAEELAVGYGSDELLTTAKATMSAHPDDREQLENDLTRVLRSTVERHAGAADGPHATVVEASRRVALARQVHNDLVRDALGQRRRPVVRLFRLGRRHPQPRFFDIDDPRLPGG
jgi:hypothetical protein